MTENEYNIVKTSEEEHDSDRLSPGSTNKSDNLSSSSDSDPTTSTGDTKF